VALAAALLAVTFLTHKMGAAIAVILLVPTTFVGLRARGHFSRLRPVHVLIGAAALLLGVLGLGLVMPERFFSRGDLALFADLLSSHAEWTAPAMSLRPDGPNPYVLTMDSEALLAGLVGVLAVASLWRRRDAIAPPVRALGLTIAGFAILLALPWLDVADPDGLGFRMRIVAFLPLALCLAIVVGATLREFGVAAQPRRVHAAVMAAIVALCLAWVLTRPRDRHAGVVKTDADMVAAISAAGAYTGTDYVIVSERHVGFMAQYYSTADVHLITERFPRDRAWAAHHRQLHRQAPRAARGHRARPGAARRGAAARPAPQPPDGHRADARGHVAARGRARRRPGPGPPAGVVQPRRLTPVGQHVAAASQPVAEVTQRCR
jgi:hypothetical protein